MNSISEDLEFTMELSRDFMDKKLPTLSFSLWEGEHGLMHSYFEKSMKNQTLVVERSALGRQNIMSIMSNEMQRRLEVIDENLCQSEKDAVIDKYTQQLVNSEFNWKQIHDIIVSGLKGYTRKEKRRMEKNTARFRSGASSLKTRVNKKLTEKYDWFRKNRINCEKEAFENSDKKDSNAERNKWHSYRNKKSPISALERRE